MARVPVENARIYWSDAIAAPFDFNLVGSVETYDATHGNEGTTRRKVFSEAAAIVKKGNKTSAYSLTILYDPDDTNGQNAIRAAYVAGTKGALAVVTDPAAAAEEGYYEIVEVTEHADRADANGDWFEGSMSFEGDGVQTAFTGGLPTV